MAKKSSKPVSGVSSDINVTPMADIMLVLLIIFMITAPMLQKGISVNMPKSKEKAEAMPDADKKGALVIGMDRFNKVYLGNKSIEGNWQPELIARLKRAQELDKDTGGKAFFKCDSSVKYKEIVSIIEAVRESNFGNLGLLVDQKKQKQQ